MARSINNVLTKGLSGMVGRQIVFRSWNGKTFISVAPKKPKKQSPLQKENRQKFKMATRYAKNMMKDAVTKAEYLEVAKKLNLPNAYTAAITDYMRNPEVIEVDTSTYSGKEEEEIKVVTRKKGFEIQEVEEIIVDKHGEIIEEGKATKGSGSDWLYKTRAIIEDKVAVQYLIRVRDKTGNFIAQRL